MTTVDRYVDAVLGVRAIRTAIADEGMTLARGQALERARIELRHAEAALKGGQLGAARRALAERERVA